MRKRFKKNTFERILTHYTYRQIPFLLQKICGKLSFSYSLSFCIAVENIIGIEVPLRAKFIRTIFSEIERIDFHLIWLSFLAKFSFSERIFLKLFSLHDKINELKYFLSKGVAIINTIGGVRVDIEACDEVFVSLREFERNFSIAVDFFNSNFFRRLSKGLGFLSREIAEKYGVKGVVGRASCIREDARKHCDYGVYGLIEWNVATCEGGDVFSRTKVLIQEIFESLKIINQCFNKIEGEKICVTVKEIPPGEGKGIVESPFGEIRHCVLSDGSNVPKKCEIMDAYENMTPLMKEIVETRAYEEKMLALSSFYPFFYFYRDEI